MDEEILEDEDESEWNDEDFDETELVTIEGELF
jgi:hypothetical protein